MEIVLRLVKKYLFVWLLLFIEAVLFAANYKPGTFFVGWDNLLPELNFKENFIRSFFGVWQENRGLGLLDGMSFVANIPHYIFLFFLSFVLPQNLLRYVFVFLMHLLGGLGMYNLLKNHTLKNDNDNSILKTDLISFFGAVFYLFNLVTVQMFYAPYELFLVHFAFLPWLSFYLLRFLEEGRKKDLLFFSLFSFLSVPQSHVPTIFIVYLLLIFVILLIYLIKQKKQILKKVMLILVAIFSINAFWGLPFFYSATQNSYVIINSKINQISNIDIFSKNKQRGTFQDLVYLKGFLIDEVEMQKDRKLHFMMSLWVEHTKSWYFYSISAIFFFIMIIGIISSFINRDIRLLPFGITLGLSFILLGTNIPVLSLITDFLRNNSSLFKEVFRFSFTKFSIIYIFCFSIFFALGLSLLSSKLTLLNYKKNAVLFLSTFLIIIFAVYTYPSFKGAFLYDALRISVPDYYFQTINFFNSQNKNERIATFPEPVFWSWKFYDWGARGSGFLWYGLNQPSTDRAFDPWSSQNENYYWESSYALYSKNLPLLESLFDKYKIKWLLVDESFLNVLSPRALYTHELEELLKNSNQIALVKKFGKIKIYQVKPKNYTQNFISIADNLPKVGPKYDWNNQDKAFIDFNHYTTGDDQKEVNIYYPFRSLFTGKNQENIEFEVKDDSDYLTFLVNLPQNIPPNLKLPSEDDSLVWIEPEKKNQMSYLSPQVSSDGKILKVMVPKVEGLLSTNINPVSDPDVKIDPSCQTKHDENNPSGISYLRLSSTFKGACSLDFWLRYPNHNIGYLLSLKNRHISGKNLYVWIESLKINKAEIESYLPKSNNFLTTNFILPPLEKDGLGYTLHINNAPLPGEQTVNDIGQISLTPIPYNFLTSIKFESDSISSGSFKNNFTSTHPLPFLYTIEKNKSSGFLSETLMLFQSFDKGWVAFSTDNGIRILNKHVLVNNWANGWSLDSNSDIRHIYIVYLPQFFEFGGFIILLSFIVLLVVKRDFK